MILPIAFNVLSCSILVCHDKGEKFSGQTGPRDVEIMESVTSTSSLASGLVVVTNFRKKSITNPSADLVILQLGLLVKLRCYIIQVHRNHIAKIAGEQKLGHIFDFI